MHLRTHTRDPHSFAGGNRELGGIASSVPHAHGVYTRTYIMRYLMWISFVGRKGNGAARMTNWE